MGTIGREDFAERRESRVERLEGRAEKLSEKAAGHFGVADGISARIPFGQPILVGHHSEARSRRAHARIDDQTRKGIEAQRAAEETGRRASAAENNRAIFSDDPDALEKLRAKLENLQGSQSRMREANAAIRAAKGDAAKAIVSLAALGFSEQVAAALVKPDPMKRIGFPSYALSNASAEMRRLRQRIEALEARAAAPTPEPEHFGAVRVLEADNRVQIHGPERVSKAAYAKLKRHGFKRTREGIWQRLPSNDAWYWAREIAKSIAAEEAA